MKKLRYNIITFGLIFAILPIILVGCVEGEESLVGDLVARNPVEQGKTHTDDQDSEGKSSQVVTKETESSENENVKSEEETKPVSQGANTEKEENPYIDLPFYQLDLVLPDGNGNMVDLKEYEGKLLFVNFFATWCGPCNEEMPLFEEYGNLYPDQLEIVIVNLNHSSREGSVEEVLAWYDEGEYTMPIVFDLDGSQTEEYLPYVQSIPMTFIYNEKGEFMTPYQGAMNEDNMNAILEYFSIK